MVGAVWLVILVLVVGGGGRRWWWQVLLSVDVGCCGRGGWRCCWLGW